MEPVAPSKYNFAAASTETLYAHSKEVLCMDWNYTGTELATGANEVAARLWTIDASGKGRENGVLKGHTNSVDALAWNPTAKNMLATTGHDNTVRIWDSRASRKSELKITTPDSNINLAWSYDGNAIAVGDTKERISIIDPRNGKILYSYMSKTQVNDIHFSPEGLLLLGGGSSKTTDPLKSRGEIQVLHLKKDEAEVIGNITCHMLAIFSVKFLPDGRHFATGAADGLVSVFDFDSLSCVATFDRLEYPVRRLSVSHDGEYIVTGSMDNCVDVTRVSDGSRMHKYDAPYCVNVVAWNPAKPVIAYSGSDANSKGEVQIVVIPPSAGSGGGGGGN